MPIKKPYRTFGLIAIVTFTGSVTISDIFAVEMCFRIGNGQMKICQSMV